MKHIILSFALWVIFGQWSLSGQSPVSLNILYDALNAKHPFQKASGIAEQIAGQQHKLNATAKWPQANLSGQATWQSEVTAIPLSFPGVDIPTPTKDQYRVLLDISQSIYDGGQQKNTTEQIKRTMNVDVTNTEVSLYALRESICRSYFGARIADLTIQQLNILLHDLEQKSSRLTAQIKEGIASGYQDAVLKVKIMETNQSIREALKQKLSAIKTIYLLTGVAIDTASLFYQNSSNSIDSMDIRPEYKLFEDQKKLQIAIHDLNSTKYQPKINAFAQLGYGRPGLNFLANEFKPYSILGLRAQWSLAHLYLKQKDREDHILQFNLQKIQILEEAFTIQQKTKSSVQEFDIKNFEASLEEDEKIIGFYEKILISSAAQFENGISTINDYANDANNLAQARIKRDVHNTLLDQAKELNYLIQGKN